MKRFAPPPEDQIGASLARLVPNDVLRFDPEQRARHLAGVSGEPQAEVIARARDEMAHVLQTAALAHDTCRFEQLSHSARRIRRLAVMAGLPDIARVADHVLDCLVQSDSVALGATVHRLSRLGELALGEMTG